MNDIFRQQYNPLTGEQEIRIKNIKEKAQELYVLISDNEVVHVQGGSCEFNLEIALAQERLQESVMWATKAHSTKGLKITKA